MKGEYEMNNLMRRLYVLFIVAILLCVSVTIANAEDITPPEIEFIEQDFGELEVGDTITIQVKITDESEIYDSGMLCFEVGKGIGDTEKKLKLSYKEDNIYESKLVITEQMQPGEWYLSWYFGCKDIKGNEANNIVYDSFVDSPIKFIVVNDDFDPIAPVILNLELVVNGNVVEPGANITVGDKIKFQMEIQEESEISEESKITVCYLYDRETYYLQYNEINDKYEMEEVEITEKIKPGVLYISGYDIKDTKNNQLYEIFSEKNSPAVYKVVNDDYDKTKPVIHSVTVDKNEQTIYPDDSITIIVDATDDKAIDCVKVRFDNHTYEMKYDEDSMRYVLTISMKGITVGKKNLSISVTDKKGNYTTNDECWVKLETPTYDDFAPVIENVTISIDKQGKTLVPNDTVTITVDLDAYDDYGIANVNLGIDGVEGLFRFYDNKIEQISDKRYQITYTISDSTAPCEYYVNRLTVEDISGNRTTYNVEELKPYYFFVNIKGSVNIPTYVVTLSNRKVDSIVKEKVIRRGTITLPDVPKVNGYTFDGWRVSKVGNYEYLQPGAKVVVMSNTTFEAMYTKNSSGNNGSGNRPGGGNNSSDDSDSDDDDDSIVDNTDSSVSTSIQQQAITQLQSVSENGSVTIDMKDTTVLSAKVLETLKTKNADLILDMGTYQWTIHKEDLWSTNLQDIDFGVKEGTSVVPQELVESITEGNPSMQIQLNHTGSFGLKAELSMKVDKTQAGKTGYLYYYDSKGVMKFIDAGKISEDGTIKLDFTHASDYVLAFCSKGALEEKWLKDSIGWWYQNADGSYPKMDWKYLNKKWYYFDQTGYMTEGWNQQGNNWYYFNLIFGDMKTGWLQLGDQWYYFNEDGTMKTGWLLYDGRWFFLKKDGTMAVGWIKDGGKWYYMTEDGAWIYS